MKISLNKIFNRSTPIQHLKQTPRTVFKPKSAPSDVYVSGVEKTIHSQDGEIISVQYFPSIKLPKVVTDLIDDSTIRSAFERIKINPKEELLQLGQEIFQSNEIRKINVKSLIGYGKRALVFETEDGQILKITKGDHFDGRAAVDFDLPIQKSGKIAPDGEYYYYLEEKASFDNINYKEVKSVIKHIKSLGYYLRDLDNEGILLTNKRFSQFGRGKDGKIYLVDPECAKKIDANESFFDKMCRWFFEY